jgi:TM2 domain-containing membrane protein YozV
MADEKSMAIVGLILNILILPGLGTLIGGGPSLKKTGIIQLVVALVSIPLMLVLIGIISYLAMWIWGIVTGIQMVQTAK